MELAECQWLPRATARQEDYAEQETARRREALRTAMRIYKKAMEAEKNV